MAGSDSRLLQQCRRLALTLTGRAALLHGQLQQYVTAIELSLMEC
jgi:hypothetical protein